VNYSLVLWDLYCAFAKQTGRIGLVLGRSEGVIKFWEPLFGAFRILEVRTRSAITSNSGSPIRPPILTLQPSFWPETT
jgi:hypothetical protein